MHKNELIVVSRLKWKRGIGRLVICGGTHTADVDGTSWDGSWFVIGCPWFQVRFERHWNLTTSSRETT